jgi:hypothetical protein
VRCPPIPIFGTSWLLRDAPAKGPFDRTDSGRLGAGTGLHAHLRPIRAIFSFNLSAAGRAHEAEQGTDSDGVGSLPRPPDLLDMIQAKERGALTHTRLSSTKRRGSRSPTTCPSTLRVSLLSDARYPAIAAIGRSGIVRCVLAEELSVDC